MSSIYDRIKRLEQIGVYCARRAEGIQEIINLSEDDIEDLVDIDLELYMDKLAQHIIYLVQEVNKGKAIENAMGRAFKEKASPVIRKAPKEELSGRSSVEERYVYASLQTDELKSLYNEWQEAYEDVMLWEDLPKAYIEKLNVYKKVHAGRVKEKSEL